MLNSGINFSFTIAMVTKVANKICLNREFSILGQRGSCICAHARIFFKLCIIMTHHIQTMKMYVLN